MAKRSEAFVLGPPLSQIATALNLSKRSEVVLAPSARCLLVDGLLDVEHPAWAQRHLASDHLVLSPTAGPEDAALLQTAPLAGSSMSLEGALNAVSSKPQLIRAKTGFYSMSRRRMAQTMDDCPAWPTEKILARMYEISQARLQISTDASLHDSTASIPANQPLSRRRLSKSRATRRATWHNDPDLLLQAISSSSGNDDMGLELLLRYTPECVRAKCLSNHNPDTLMEHRLVTILFVIANLQVRRHPCSIASRCLHASLSGLACTCKIQASTHLLSPPLMDAALATGP